MKVPVHDLRDKARRQVEARWPALIASLATGVLFYAIPESLTVGPDWLLLVVIAALMIPTSLAHKTGRVGLNMIFGYSVLVVITLAVLSSLVLLITRLPARIVVLASGWRWAERARQTGRPHGRCVPVSPDEDGPGTQARNG